MTPSIEEGSTVSDLSKYRERFRSRSPAGSGGDDGGQDDMERRVAALEEGQKLIISKLDGISDGIRDQRLEVRDLRSEQEKRFGVIESRLTGIEKMLESKASTADLKEISGKVSSIPTTWQTVAIIGALLVGIGGLSFSISGLRQAPSPSSTTTTAPTGRLP